MATLRLTFLDLYTHVSEFLGIGSSPTGTNLTKVKAIVNRAYRQFLSPIDTRVNKPHTWSWLKKQATLLTVADKWQYALPDDFGYLTSDFHYDDEVGYGPIVKRSADFIWNQRKDITSSDYPMAYAVVPSMHDKDTGTAWDVWFYPPPNGAYLLRYAYMIQPQKLESDTDYPLGGVFAAEALLELCLAVAEQQDDDMQTTHHTELANDMLQKLVVMDTIDAADSVGFLVNLAPGLFGRFAELRNLRSSVADADVYADDR